MARGRAPGKELLRERVEVERDIVGGLHWAGDEFPFLDSFHSVLGKDRITAQDFDVAYRSVGKYPRSKPNQAADSSSLQEFRIFGLCRYEHFAFKLWSFLGGRGENESRGQTEGQDQNRREQTPADAPRGWRIRMQRTKIIMGQSRLVLARTLQHQAITISDGAAAHKVTKVSRQRSQ
jgi:hypothetical protein